MLLTVYNVLIKKKPLNKDLLNIMIMDLKQIRKLENFMLKEISTWLDLLSFYPCKFICTVAVEFIICSCLNDIRILERTSTLLIQMLKHEELLEDAKKEHVSSKEDEKRLLDMENKYETQIKELELELKDLLQEERDFENLKKQIKQQTEDYHKLAGEKNKFSA